MDQRSDERSLDDMQAAMLLVRQVLQEAPAPLTLHELDRLLRMASEVKAGRRTLLTCARAEGRGQDLWIKGYREAA